MSLIYDPYDSTHTADNPLLAVVERRIKQLTNLERDSVLEAIRCCFVGYNPRLTVVSAKVFAADGIEWSLINGDLNWRPVGASYEAWAELHPGDVYALKELERHLSRANKA